MDEVCRISDRGVPAYGKIKKRVHGCILRRQWTAAALRLSGHGIFAHIGWNFDETEICAYSPADRAEPTGHDGRTEFSGFWNVTFNPYGEALGTVVGVIR